MKPLIKPIMTRQIAFAIGRDAANTAMRDAGRNMWSIEDWRVGCKALAEALRSMDPECKRLASGPSAMEEA